MVNRRRQAAIDRAQSRLLRSEQIAATIERFRDHMTRETYANLRSRFAPRLLLGQRVAPNFRMDTQIEEALYSANTVRRHDRRRYISQRLLAQANRDIAATRAERSSRPLGLDTLDESVQGFGALLERERPAAQAPVRSLGAPDVRLRLIARFRDGSGVRYSTFFVRAHRSELRDLGVQTGVLYSDEAATARERLAFQYLAEAIDDYVPGAYNKAAEAAKRDVIAALASNANGIVVRDVQDLAVDRPVMDPLTLPNRLSGTYIANPYLTYRAAHAAGLADRFKVQTEYVDSCGVDILMRWKEPIEKCGKHKRLCIDGKFTLRALFEKVLCRKFEPRFEHDASNIPLSMGDMIAFCRKFRIVLRAFDARGNLVLSYSPSMDGNSPNNNMPSSMYLVWAHAHFELMSKEQVNSLSKRRGMHDAETTEYRVYADLKVSEHYHIRDYERDGAEAPVLCRTITELAELFRGLERAYDADGKERRVVAHCAVNIDLVYFFFSNMNQYLSAQFRATMTAKQLVYRYNKVTVVVYNAATGLAGATGQAALAPPTQAYYDEYLAWNNKVQAALVNKQNLSHYSRDLAALFEEYGRTALCGTLRSVASDSRFDAIDICKCYTSALIKQDKLPCFSAFDDYYAYDGHDIEDYTLYVVSLRQEAHGIWLIKYNQQHNLCFGRNIRADHAAGLLDVHGFVRPYRLRDNYAAAVIEELYRSELETKDKKFIVNAAIGVCGKKHNKKHDTAVCHSYDEAVAHLGGADQGDIVARTQSDFADLDLDSESDEVRALLEQSLSTESFGGASLTVLRSTRELFLAQRSTKATLRNGFYPIQHLIYDQTRHDMFELAKRCEQAGALVCAIRTDCLYIADCENPRALTTYKEPEWVDVGGALSAPLPTNDELIASIGTVRCEDECLPAHKLPRTRIEKLSNQPLEYTTDDCNVFRTEREREWRTSDAWQQDVFAFMQQHDKVFVKGVTAGSGKTSIILRYIHSLGKMASTLFVFPDNATILEMKQKCAREFGCVPQMKTAHKLLGIAFDEKLNELERGEASTDGVECVVLDEMYKYDMSILLRIRGFMQRNPGLKFIGAGDIFQLEPINDSLDNVRKPQLYRQRCIAKLFDKNEVYLQCSKRFTSEADERAIADIKRDLFEHGLSVEEVVRKYGIAERTFDPATFDEKTTCIALSNYTRRKVAAVINRKATAGLECVEVLDKEGYVLRYHVGMKIVSRERIKAGAAVIQKNYLLEVRALQDGNVVLHEPLEGTEYTLTQDKLRFFAVENSRTGYSIQGATLEGPTAIFDLHSAHMSREWFYTAITRNRRLCDNTVYHVQGTNRVGTVYRIECALDGKVYVGSTERPLDERVKEHFASARQNSQLRLHRHIREHGEQAFRVSVLDATTDLDALRDLEGRYIAELKPELNLRCESAHLF